MVYAWVALRSSAARFRECPNPDGLSFPVRDRHPYGTKPSHASMRGFGRASEELVRHGVKVTPIAMRGGLY